jgi:hypothetical protein
MGESLNELYERIHAVDARKKHFFTCTQTPTGTSSYHCEIEELTEKYGWEVE